MSGHYTNFIDAPEKLRMISLLLVAYIKYLVYLKCKRGHLHGRSGAMKAWGTFTAPTQFLYCPCIQPSLGTPVLSRYFQNVLFLKSLVPFLLIQCVCRPWNLGKDPSSFQTHSCKIPNKKIGNLITSEIWMFPVANIIQWKSVFTW